MSKNPQPITAQEIEQAILEGDDFGHELRAGDVISDRLNDPGNDPLCVVSVSRHEHGGTYVDSITGKPRQFDYRFCVRRVSAGKLSDTIWFAVECKNLHKSAPLVISGRLRTLDEAYHCFVTCWMDDGRLVFSQTKRIEAHQSHFYPAGKFVGKSVLRVKRDGTGKGKAEADADVYDKWSQALQSCVELAEDACWCVNEYTTKSLCSFVVPIVVVPDNTLWKVEYGLDGTIQQGGPTPTEFCEFWVDRKLKIGGSRPLGEMKPFRFSHIHFVTIEGFRKLIAQFYSENIWEFLFNPHSAVAVPD